MALGDNEPAEKNYASAFKRLERFVHQGKNIEHDLFQHNPKETIFYKTNDLFYKNYVQSPYQLTSLNPSNKHPARSDLEKTINLSSKHLSWIGLAKINNSLFAQRLYHAMKNLALELFYYWPRTLVFRMKQTAYQAAFEASHDNQFESNLETTLTDIEKEQEEKLRNQFNQLARYLKANQYGHVNEWPSNQSLNTFINPFIKHFSHTEHRYSQSTDDNSLKHLAKIIGHVAHFFYDYNDRNPIIGFFAHLAFIFGFLAILYPNLLTSLLTTFHLTFLITLIPVTQTLAKFLGHGRFSETICASSTYWKLTVLIGHLDDLLIQGITKITQHPLEIILCFSAALALGAFIVDVLGFAHGIGTFWPYAYTLIGFKFGLGFADFAYNPKDSFLKAVILDIGEFLFLISRTGIEPFMAAYQASSKGHWIALKAFYLGWRLSFKHIIKKMINGVETVIHVILTLFEIFHTCLIPFLFLTPLRALGPIIGKCLGFLVNPSIVIAYLKQFVNYSFEPIKLTVQPHPEDSWLQHHFRLLVQTMVVLIASIIQLIHRPLALVVHGFIRALTLLDHAMNPRLNEFFTHLALLSKFNRLSNSFTKIATRCTPSPETIQTQENNAIQSHCARHPGLGLLIDMFKVKVVWFFFEIEHFAIDCWKHAGASFIRYIKLVVHKKLHQTMPDEIKQPPTKVPFEPTLSSILTVMHITPPNNEAIGSMHDGLSPPMTKTLAALQPGIANNPASLTSS